MESSEHRTGIVNGIRFEIKDSITIKIWKPDGIDFYDFKSKCDRVIRYLMDEGFFNNKKCKVEVIT